MFVSNRILGNVTTIAQLKTYQVGVIEAAAHRALREQKDSLLSEYGLSGVEWYLIGTVADAGKQGITSTELAKLLGTTLGFLTKTVSLLEAKNVLYKIANPKDARSSYIALNDSYRTTLDTIECALRDKLRDSIYSVVSREQLGTYIEVMNKFSTLEK